MAKTTRKTDSTKTTPKPAVRRRRAIDESAPVEPVTTRRKTATTTKKVTRVVATANDRNDSAQTAAVSASYEPTHEEISVRAYHIHLRRHGQPGNPEHDWQQAIHELRTERS